MLSGGTPSRRSACFFMLWLCSDLAEQEPILFIVYVPLCQCGSHTGQPHQQAAKAKSNSNESSTKSNLILLKNKKYVVFKSCL